MAKINLPLFHYGVIIVVRDTVSGLDGELQAQT